MDYSNANRRSFLLGVAAAAASAGYFAAGIPGPARAAQAQGGRKVVMVAGKRVKVVDIHAHCVMPKVADVLKGTDIKGQFPANQILGPERMAAMDQRGIDFEALSINQYWWYDANRDLAARIVRVHDEGIAEWVRGHSDRFVGLTSVALQHPDLAAEQLDYAVKTLGLRGASIGGNVKGEFPSSEKFDPFWKKAEELQVPVFMHPTNADFLVKDEIFNGRGDLGNIVGNPFETALFLTKLIFDGTFDRFPGLKVFGGHAGGYLPSYFGRTEATCKVRPNARCANTKLPSEYLKTNIMADSMVFSDEGLRHLVAEMGAGQIVYGTDTPFNWPDTLDLIVNAKFLSDAEKEAMLGGNLIKMLKIAA